MAGALQRPCSEASEHPLLASTGSLHTTAVLSVRRQGKKFTLVSHPSGQPGVTLGAGQTPFCKCTEALLQVLVQGGGGEERGTKANSCSHILLDQRRTEVWRVKMSARPQPTMGQEPPVWLCPHQAV